MEVTGDLRAARLRVMPKVPNTGIKTPLMRQSGHLVRGLETVHTDFIHKQFGIVVRCCIFLLFLHLRNNKILFGCG